MAVIDWLNFNADEAGGAGGGGGTGGAGEAGEAVDVDGIEEADGACVGSDAGIVRLFKSTKSMTRDFMILIQAVKLFKFSAQMWFSKPDWTGNSFVY